MENFWKNKQVFITGANGFLGSHLTKALGERGVEPVVLIYEKNPGGIFDEENTCKKTRVVEGDIRNSDLMKKILKDFNIDTIFHLAAQSIVDYAVDDPTGTLEINIQGTWNILEAARKSGRVERIVFASSDKAYGHHEKLPYEEDTHALKGIYPYEVSKTCADIIAQSYHRTFGVPVCITRCTNLYGPGDLKMNRIVPNTIKCLHHNMSPILRDTGESVRDYLFVEDAVEGYLRLAEKMNETTYGHAFNFSTNTPLSALDAITLISNEMEKDIQPVLVKSKGFEISRQYASYAKSENILGWKPAHSFTDGLKKTIPWYVDHLRNATREKPQKIV